MSRTYNQQNPDGSWSQVTQNDNGTYTTVPIDPSGYGSANIPTGGSTPPSGGDPSQTYDTPNGKKTLSQMQDGLRGAGWGGDYNDPAAVIAQYNKTASEASNGSADTGASAVQKLVDAAASGNQADFDEAVREFNQNFGENQRQFNLNFGENQRQFDRSQYSDLATHLLDTATELDRPKDYFDFNKYTSGGRDLFQQLFGDQPRPDFSAPTGKIEPETIEDLMAKLGFTTAPSGSTPSTSTSTGTAGTYNTINGPKTLDQMAAELKVANPGGVYTDPNVIISTYASTTKGAVTPASTTPAATPAVTPQVAAQAVTTGDHPAVAPPVPINPTVLANQGPAITSAPTTPLSGLTNTLAPPAPTTVAPATTPLDPTVLANQGPAITSQPSVGGTLQPAAQTTQATTTAAAASDPTKAMPVPAGQGWPTVSNPQTPLPYQINPAVWDSMGTVGQQLTLSAAAAAGWDTDEFLRQLDASRPKGTAPASSTTQFKTQVGAFS